MRGLLFRRLRLFICAVLVVFTTGCATTGALDERDPLEGFNRGVYSLNQGMDKVIFDPLSKL
ncbi:MAG: MlaA family lipoprotein, partial [Gammaproteobacteria bacterium]